MPNGWCVIAAKADTITLDQPSMTVSKLVNTTVIDTVAITGNDHAPYTSVNNPRNCREKIFATCRYRNAFSKHQLSTYNHEEYRNYRGSGKTNIKVE